MLTKRIVVLLISILFMISICSPSLSAVPLLINYQGKLTDSDGTPLNGQQLVNFYIHDVESDGTHLWTEGQFVDVENGIFQVQLGSDTPLSTSLFDNASLYLEVEIFASGTGWEMLTPRQQLTSNAFTIKAANADMLEGNTLTQLDDRYVGNTDVGVVTSEMIADSSVGSSDIQDNSLTNLDLAADSVGSSELAPNAVSGSEVLDGSIQAVDLADNYVNTTGDTMSGDLTVNSDINAVNSSANEDDYTATFESTGGTTAYSVKGVANSTRHAQGLDLDVDSTDFTATGGYIDVNGYVRGRALDLTSYSSIGTSTGILIDSSVGVDSTMSSTGINSSAGQNGTGESYGLWSISGHNGVSGYSYGLNSKAFGSDTGNAYGVYAKASKNDVDTDGTAYGGYFIGDNDRYGSALTDSSYGVLGEATGLNSTRFGVYGRATTTGDSRVNVGVHAEASTSGFGYAYGLSSNVTVPSSSSSSESEVYGSYFAVSNWDYDRNIDSYGSMAHVSNGSASSGNVFGYYAKVFPSDTGNAYGFYSYAWSPYTSGITYAGYFDAHIDQPLSGVAYAGYFNGDVDITGTLSKAGGSFKIDHPLEPEDKYLQHSFVESPDMKNVYDGTVVLDNQGDAWVELPDYFEALNRDFRYQLTCIGDFAQVYIAMKVANNRFKIAGGKPNMEVSWQVTGIRQDAWAEEHRIEVEIDKEGKEQGSYLYPELFGMDETRSVDYARDPEMVKERMKMRKEREADKG